MSSSYREKKANDPDFFIEEIPRELNPELFETVFDWEAEEKALREEERRKKADACRQKTGIKSPARKWLDGK